MNVSRSVQNKSRRWNAAGVNMPFDILLHLRSIPIPKILLTVIAFHRSTGVTPRFLCDEGNKKASRNALLRKALPFGARGFEPPTF